MNEFRIPGAMPVRQSNTVGYAPAGGFARHLPADNTSGFSRNVNFQNSEIDSGTSKRDFAAWNPLLNAKNSRIKTIHNETGAILNPLNTNILGSSSTFYGALPPSINERTLFFPNGDRYEGDLVNLKPHCRGSFTFASGNRYVGDFVDGIPTGKAIFFWSFGDIYEGHFIGGIRFGEGTYIWANGEKYVGHFIGGLANGQGIFTWPDGKKYEGSFFNGLANGIGIYSWPDGEKFVAFFVNGTAFPIPNPSSSSSILCGPSSEWR